MASTYSFYDDENHTSKNHHHHRQKQEQQEQQTLPTTQGEHPAPTTEYRNYDDDSFFSTASTKPPFMSGPNRGHREGHHNDGSCSSGDANGINRHRILLNEYSSNLKQQQQEYHYHPRAVLKTLFSSTGNGGNQDWKDDLNRKHSYLYVMLHPRSTEWQSERFKLVICTIIVVDLIIFALSTEPALQGYHVWFRVADGLTSTIFLIEYIVRLLTATENQKYASLGPVMGRLRYMVSFSAIIDALATLPFFLQLVTGWDKVPTLTYLRVFRILRILRTDGYSRTMGACYRVVYYNREILSVAMLVCLFLVMITSMALYYFRPPEDGTSDYESIYGGEFRSLPATVYLAVLILTGQDQFVRDSQGMPWYTKAVVASTGTLSIAMYAIPVSLLTWGFEAEAERCAKKARKSMKYAQSTVTQTSSSKGGEGGVDSGGGSNSPVLVQQCNSDEEYQRILARERSTALIPPDGNADRMIFLDLSESPSDMSATSNVKELVDTFLQNDHNGMGVEALTEFLTHQLQAQCQRSQNLVSSHPQRRATTHPPPPQPSHQAASLSSSMGSWVGGDLATIDVSSRVQALESTVGAMHSKLDQLCQLLLSEREVPMESQPTPKGTEVSVPLPLHRKDDWVRVWMGSQQDGPISSRAPRNKEGGVVTTSQSEPSREKPPVPTKGNNNIYRPTAATTTTATSTLRTRTRGAPSRFASHGSW